MKITRTTASVSSVIFTVCCYLITVVMPPWFYMIATGSWLPAGWHAGQLSVFKLLGGRLWGSHHLHRWFGVGIWDSGNRKYYEIWECNRSAASALSPVYTIQPVDNQLHMCIHDTTDCQSSCETGLTTGSTTGCIVYTAGCGWTNSGCSFNTVVKPLVQPV